MDKPKLFYLVKRGTNENVLTMDKRPFIAESDATDREIEQWYKSHEKMSIKDYEDKFEENE